MRRLQFECFCAALLLLGLVLTSQSRAAEIDSACLNPGYLGPRQIDVGDMVFRIPSGQCFEAQPGLVLRNIGTGLADPVITGPFDDIRIWHPYMSQIAGTRLEPLQEPYGLSLLISLDDTTWDKKPKMPVDDWCSWLFQENLLHISDLQDDVVQNNGFSVYWISQSGFHVILNEPQKFFGSPIIIWGYKSGGIFNFNTNVALSDHVRMNITFDSVDLQSIDIKSLLRNIDQNVGRWIDRRRSPPLFHERRPVCRE